MNIDPRQYPYGSASFASDQEIRRAFRVRGGLPIAFHRGRLLTHSGRAGMLLISGAGAGKFACLLAHTSLTPVAMCMPRRALWYSPKGEEAAVLGWGLVQDGAHVYFINTHNRHGLPSHTVDLSRFRAAPIAHLCSLCFEGQWAFPAEC